MVLVPLNYFLQFPDHTKIHMYKFLSETSKGGMNIFGKKTPYSVPILHLDSVFGT